MKYLKKYILSISFITFILIFSILDILQPIRGYSDLENRTLKNKPVLSFRSIIKGDYTKEYDKYINDQFLLRNTWIDIKSRVEALLNKQENNGVVFGDYGYLFDKHQTVDEAYINNNVNALNKFIEEYNLKSDLILIPSSYEIYDEYVPKGLKLVNQDTYIKDIYSKFNGNSIYLGETFNNEKHNYIYYKTDHHYTTYGAYLTYIEYIKEQGLIPATLSIFTANIVDNFYGTFFSKTLSIKETPDSITYYNVDNLTITINGEEKKSLYNLKKFDERDKYAAFLWGNNGYTKIVNKNIEKSRVGSKLLLIKDSYGNSFAPFISKNYEEVHIIDLRDYRDNLRELLEENCFEDTLILYSFKNFSTDTNILKLNFY